MARQALIIEDDPAIAELVALHLRDIQIESVIHADGAAGLAAFRDDSFDLVVLDLMLPGMDGLSVCQKIRALPGYVPILMLTAKSTELDRVLGLEMGADDYLTKPFSVPELVARVRALLRRVDALATSEEQSDTDMVFERGGLLVDLGKRRVVVDEAEVALTAKEFDLLAYFIRHPGQVYNRVQLLDQVWGYNHEGYEHTVNSHINRLRGKIEANPAKPRYILTVWGVGYKFSDQL